MSRASIQKAVAGVALGTGLVATGAAKAGVVYDLRFADGSHTQAAVAGQTYNLELWARVSGTNGNNLDEGIQSIIGTIVSTQANGGALASGGITSVAIPATFQSFSGTQPLHTPGTSNNITADGIVDWGGTSTSTADPGYIVPRANGILTGATAGQAVNANTWEFQMATLTITVGALNNSATTGSVTAFNAVKPIATGPGIAATYIVARVDNVAYGVASNNATRIADTYNNSQGVTFVPVPEPTSLGLMGAATVGLLGRRRQMK